MICKDCICYDDKHHWCIGHGIPCSPDSPFPNECRLFVEIEPKEG